jgi:hypothetical protein
MGVIKKGILGGVAGTVGNVVGGNWKGIDYLRSKPASVANPKTLKQQTQRAKFTTILNFLKPLTSLLSIGYKNYATGMTGFNVAMSYNVKNAITGTYPSFTVNYPVAQISKGNLTGASTPTVASTVARNIVFTWQNNAGTGNALATDTAILVAFFPTINEAVYQVTTIGRSAATATLNCPARYSTRQAHCWIVFQTADGQLQATSNYIGTVTVV